jgi:DNA-binding MarR family transcriptional regulator
MCVGEQWVDIMTMSTTTPDVVLEQADRAAETTPVLRFATQSATHLLHRAGQHAEDMFARATADLGITARQFVVLAAIDGLERPSQTTLCETSGIDRSTLADIVRRLEMRGLIHRERTKADARMYAVSVTDEGRALLMRAAPIATDVERELLAQFSAAEQETFKSLLRRVMTQELPSAA